MKIRLTLLFCSVLGFSACGGGTEEEATNLAPTGLIFASANDPQPSNLGVFQASDPDGDTLVFSLLSQRNLSCSRARY